VALIALSSHKANLHYFDLLHNKSKIVQQIHNVVDLQEVALYRIIKQFIVD